MYQKILVALDLTAGSDTVFTQALNLAKLTNADLYILHVLSPEEENSPLLIPPNLMELYPVTGNDLTLTTWQQQWENFANLGLEMLAIKAKQANQAQVKTEYQQITGNPGKIICEYAQQENIDLVVVGHRGLLGISEALLGSVSNYVMHHACCSILIVQSPS